MSANGSDGMLKMKELAEASGVSAGTIKHYLREGLLPEPVRTSRNMAYYPPEFVERIKLIKQLQEERYLPLKLIRAVLEGERTRISAAELRKRYGVPQDVLDRLCELEVLTPTSRGYGPRDVEIVAAISRFRAGGYDERLGFTVYDTLRYKEALQPLAEEEARLLMDRVLEADRAIELIESGVEPLNALVAALHQKLLLAELTKARRATP
jgi:DNA-binding transcriptional MerR regulator